jgi:2-phospho-L-lactate guanylyltransferase
MQPVQKAWAVVVPVKRLEQAKSRLSLPAVARMRLALAMAEDTVRACLAARSVHTVVVVTDDAAGAAMATSLGATVVADEPDAGLNPALRHGARVALRTYPSLGVATVSSDLPALSGPDLDAALRSTDGHDLVVVADAEGSGTALLASGSLAHFQPAFGPDSRAAHVGTGAVDLTALAAPGVRRDVDRVEDLAVAWMLGCGLATRIVVEDLGGIERLTSST